MGPIIIAFGDEGRCIRFRSLAMATIDLHVLIEGAFNAVAGLYPQFDVESAPTPREFAKLQMSMRIEVFKEG